MPNCCCNPCNWERRITSRRSKWKSAQPANSLHSGWIGHGSIGACVREQTRFERHHFGSGADIGGYAAQCRLSAINRYHGAIGLNRSIPAALNMGVAPDDFSKSNKAMLASLSLELLLTPLVNT